MEIKHDKNLASQDWEKILLFKNCIYQAAKKIYNIRINRVEISIFLFMMQQMNRFVFGKRLIESFGSCYNIKYFVNSI